MKKVGKPVFFIIVLLIACLGYLTIFGVSSRYGDVYTTRIKGIADIRWGIDIRGGVDVTFMPAGDYDADEMQLYKVEDVLKSRLVSLGIMDSDVYTDMQQDRVIVRFPWKAEESAFDPETAIAELGQTSHLTFRPGKDRDESGKPAGETAATVLVEGGHVVSARVGTHADTRQYIVILDFSEEGKRLFTEATRQQAGKIISIWMDDEMISAAEVKDIYTGGEAYIEGNFSYDRAATLARQISSGALPFKLVAENYSVISPTLGMGARDAMIIAGAIAFVFIALFMISFYRVPGAVAVIAIVGQLFIMVAGITGFLPAIPSFTLTLPGIAGIILSMGFGVDANIITASRIREEFYTGKNVETAVYQGYKRALRAVVDSNITVLIIAVVLMSGFGTPNSFLVKAFSALFYMHGASTTGSIYSFGYTLLVGVIANMLMGVLASQYMLKSLIGFKTLRKPALFVGRNKPKVFGYKIVEKYKVFFAASAALMATAFLWSMSVGIELGIQFKGGTIITYDFDGKLDKTAFQGKIEGLIHENVTLQETADIASGASYYVVSLASNKGISVEEQSGLTEALQRAFPDNNIHIESVNVVNPTIGRAFFKKSARIMLIAVALLLTFIGWRFRNIGGISAGVSAILAVAHDLFVVLAVFIFLRIPLDDNFIAVVLFIMGYSLNDTVVIFDRVRENRLLLPQIPIGELVNLSINQSLSRSVATTFTTVASMAVVTVIALLYNVESILPFSFPMIIGMLSGVYSSLCIAGSLWVRWQQGDHKYKKK